MHGLGKPHLFDSLELFPNEFGVGRGEADGGFVAGVSKGVYFEGFHILDSYDITKQDSNGIQVVMQDLIIKSSDLPVQFCIDNFRMEIDNLC